MDVLNPRVWIKEELVSAMVANLVGGLTSALDPVLDGGMDDFVSLTHDPTSKLLHMPRGMPWCRVKTDIQAHASRSRESVLASPYTPGYTTSDILDQVSSVLDNGGGPETSFPHDTVPALTPPRDEPPVEPIFSDDAHYIEPSHGVDDMEEDSHPSRTSSTGTDPDSSNKIVAHSDEAGILARRHETARDGQITEGRSDTSTRLVSTKTRNARRPQPIPNKKPQASTKVKPTHKRTSSPSKKGLVPYTWRFDPTKTAFGEASYIRGLPGNRPMVLKTRSEMSTQNKFLLHLNDYIRQVVSPLCFE